MAKGGALHARTCGRHRCSSWTRRPPPRDARAEYEVFQRFSELTLGKSAVLISHRFSTVRMADRILVLENGTLIEIGSHEELLALGGRYAELFQPRRGVTANSSLPSPATTARGPFPRGRLP